MKSVKLSEYFQVIKPEYVFIKLKPNNSIRNNSTHLIARSISSLYKTVFQCIKKEEEKVISVLGKQFLVPTKSSFQLQGKVSYYIYIEKNKVDFYFIIPKHHLSIVKEKISDVWSNITMDEVREIPTFTKKASNYQMVYEKEDGLSLNVDRTSNDLLNSNLNVVDVMEEGDKVGIFYNFLPSSQDSFRNSYRHTIERVKKGIPVDRKKFGVNYVFKMTISLLDGIVQDISDILSGGKKEKTEERVLERIIERLNGGTQITSSTERKGKSLVIPTQVLLFSESDDKMRQRNNGFSLSQSFDVISEDNKLIPKKFNKKKINLTDYNLGTEINKIGDEEAQNFLCMPGRELLERHNFIEKVETQETQVPEDLQKGVIRLGTNTYRGHEQEAYLSTHKEYKQLALVVMGPNGSGKSTYFGNLSHDAIDAGECVVIFDFIKNCELSNEVSALFPQDKILNIECDDSEELQGLGYNEVPFSDDPTQRYINAKTQTAQLKTLVNSINSDDTPLSARMNRYLTSAALTVFINNGSIKDVFGVLQNAKKRNDYLLKIPESQFENMEEYIDYLLELDQMDDKGNVKGTKLHLVEGIISRLNALKDNPYLEMMLKKDCDSNINLVEELQKNQLICIKMPESMFPTDDERDIYTTYWMTKIWLAIQLRGQNIKDRNKLTKVNLVIDELYQVRNTEKFLTDKLSRLRKFGLKPILSCHYLKQIHQIRNELRAASTSYMLVSGCDKENFKELKEELYPFELDDLLSLPEHHSMNLIKYKGGYGRFITHLPGPVSQKDPDEQVRTSQKEVASTK